MKKNIPILTLIFLTNSILYSQTIQLPWHVVDRGGGKGTSGGITLHASIGQSVVRASASGGIYLEEGYIPGVRKLGGALTSLELDAEETWNMVSVPLIVSDFRKTVLYPTANSAAFAYKSSYQQHDTLKNGVGYWVKFPAQNVVQFAGTTIQQETVDVNNNWNMIGCLSYPILVSDIVSIAPTTVTSSYFGYSSASGYSIDDTLKPGKAYWVKINTAGQIVLKTGSVIAVPSTSTLAAKIKPSISKLPQQLRDIEGLHTLTFRDANGHERSLYFSSCPKKNDNHVYDLPPYPPSGMDVRYVDDQMVVFAELNSEKTFGIHITSAEYPVTISWRSDGNPEKISFIIDGKAISTNEQGDVHITHPTSDIHLRLSPASMNELPKEFALDQNYPNPFNPSTVIRYQLPFQSNVTLKLYDVLGREVITLIDEIQEAGFKRAIWNAGDFAGGVYFYSLTAGSFHDVKKMVLIK